MIFVQISVLRKLKLMSSIKLFSILSNIKLLFITNDVKSIDFLRRYLRWLESSLDILHKLHFLVHVSFYLCKIHQLKKKIK